MKPKPIHAIGFNGGQFGDLVIQTVPARAFKEQAPEGSKLTFAVAEKYRDILPLFFHHPHIDDYHVWEGYDNWPNQADRDYIHWRRFDHVFNAMAGHTQQDWYNHRTYGEEACLRHGLRPPKDLSYLLNPWMPLWKDCKNVVTLTLFPSKGSQMDKGLTIPEAENLCILLKAAGYKPIQLGGKFEVKLENAEAPSLSILEAAILMLSSKLHITADTGFSSIAAGYKHPTLGFYGINYPDMKDCFSHLPPNPNALYLKNTPPNSVKAEQLLTMAQQGGLL